MIQKNLKTCRVEKECGVTSMTTECRVLKESWERGRETTTVDVFSSSEVGNSSEEADDSNEGEYSEEMNDSDKEEADP